MTKKTAKIDESTTGTVNADDDSQVHLTLDELNVVARLISDFSEEVFPIFLDDDGKTIYFPDRIVRKVMTECYTGDWLEVDGGDEQEGDPWCGYTLLSAEEVVSDVQETHLPQRVKEAFVKWFTRYYLPRIRYAPDIYADMPSSERKWIEAMQEAKECKPRLPREYRKYDAIKARLLGRTCVLDILAKRVAAVNGIFERLTKYYSPCSQPEWNVNRVQTLGTDNLEDDMEVSF